ncbi:acyl carrier protein [Pseudomonas putida]
MNERAVVAVWEQVLGQKSASVKDDFFESGGTSIQLLKLLHEVQGEFGVIIDFNEFYRTPTLERFVHLVMVEK